MNTLWSYYRRLVASIMLVAVASFVLHGGAMAGLHQHGPGSTECATTAPVGHVHPAASHEHPTPDLHEAAHDHGEGVAHNHAKADLPGETAPSDQQAAGEGTPCCASVCAIALTAFGLDTTSAPIGVSVVLVPESQRGSGIDPNGLKRPPRTPDIA